MKASLQVMFSGCCEAGYPCAIVIERDEDRNGGKSSFALGDEIFYRVRPAGSYRYRITNGGLISVVSATVEEKVEEEVVVSGDYVNAGAVISGNFSYDWMGKAINPETGLFCSPDATARLGTALITLPYVVRGVLKLTYRSDYTLVRFAPAKPGKQLVEVAPLESESSPSEVYEFGNGECEGPMLCTSTYIVEDISAEEEGAEEVILRIIDACNGNPVPGAQVVVDGTLIVGITDVDGKINVGFLSEGFHDIVVTAAGFVPSDEDTLDNDRIEV